MQLMEKIWKLICINLFIQKNKIQTFLKDAQIWNSDSYKKCEGKSNKWETGKHYMWLIIHSIRNLACQKKITYSSDLYCSSTAR